MSILEHLRTKTDYVRNIIPLEKRNKDVIFVLVLFGMTMNNFNVAATFTTSVNIQQNFGATSTIASWVLSAYALTLGSFILIFGKISDILGPHNVFLYGLTMIWLCSLVSALITNSIIALIVFRALQGIGAAALVPSGFAIAGNYHRDDIKKLGRAISGLIVALTASFEVGTIVGGAFDFTKLGYKSLYYFVFGFTFVVNIILFLLIIPVTMTEKHKELKLSNLDFPAVLLLMVGILLMILGLTEGGTNWDSPKAYVPLPVGISLFVLVFLYETCHIRAFQIKSQNINTEELNRYDQWRTKLILLISSLVSIGCYVWLSFLKYDIHNAYWKFEFFSIFFFGIGTNIYFNIYLNAVFTHTPLHLQGAVSGIYQTFSQVSVCIANAIVASILGSITYASTPAEKQVLHNKFMSVHYVGIALLAVVVFTLLFAKNVYLSRSKSECEMVDIER